MGKIQPDLNYKKNGKDAINAWIGIIEKKVRIKITKLSHLVLVELMDLANLVLLKYILIKINSH